MKNPHDSTVAPFDRDAVSNAGYLYTTGARVSSQMANQRLTDAAMEAVSFRGKRVLDLGCGDGTYTMDLFDRGQPAYICGVDPAQKAIEVARQKAAGRTIEFAVESAYQLPFEKDHFDIAHLRGVLHHMDRPEVAVREALRVASTVVIIEPNGYNPVLKLLERLSSYHREHEEKSYPSHKLKLWIEEAGGEVRSQQWAGLVPFFCPDPMARLLKVVEPLCERLPLFRLLSCAVCVLVAVRREVGVERGRA